MELQLPPLNTPLVFQRTILELSMPQVCPACSLTNVLSQDWPLALLQHFTSNPGLQTTRHGMY